jgi:tight adherence protein B
MILYISVFLVLAVGAFAFITGLDVRSQATKVMRERLATIETAIARDPNSQAVVLRDEMLSSVPALNRVFKESAVISKLQQILTQAGLKTRAGKLVLICACVGSAMALIANQFAGFLYAIAALVIGCCLPVAVVVNLRKRRFNKFEEFLPQAIELLSRAVRSGHSLSSAIEVIGEELPEPVSGEFRLLYDEQRFGLPMRDAMLNLAERIPLVDVKFFTVAVLLQREAGGNLAEILDKLALVIRERFKIMRQVKVYTAQGRMSMIILLLMPFALAGAISYFSPSSMQLLVTDPIGQKLIGAGLIMLTLGFFVIRKIVTVRV